MPKQGRNLCLGQVWTPKGIALKMVKAAMGRFPQNNCISVLDPAVGPFTFPQAFIDAGVAERVHSFTMIDVDPRMTRISRGLCPRKPSWNVIRKDYLLGEGSSSYDLVIMNPPYVRQEEIPSKTKAIYYKDIEARYGVIVNKRSNLFVLFLLKALTNVRNGGIVCAIVYDAILSSRYGKQALELMKKCSTLVSSEHISEPFGDALIDAQIMMWRKNDFANVTSFLNEMPKPKSQDGMKKISDLMSVVRGFTVPYRKAFIVPQDVKADFETCEILIKQRDPNIFTCETSSRIVYDTSDARALHYIKGRLDRRKDVSKIKFSKCDRVGDICFNYYLRDKPRHLMNERGIQIADNFYVCTVLNGFPVKAAWVLLNSDLYLKAILSCGRNQGDGLIKLQAYEYKSALVPDWGRLTQVRIRKLISTANSLLEDRPSYEEFRRRASKVAEEVFK